MDDDIEDMVGEVKYTDSQKSITATTRSSLMYSPDFTDTSSLQEFDKHNSTGKETYVIECDSEDLEGSEQIFPLHDGASTINGDSEKIYPLPNYTSTVNMSGDSEKIFPLHDCASTINGDSQEIFPNNDCASTTNEELESITISESCNAPVTSVQCGPSKTITKCASTSYHTIHSVVAQEIYTQTSKTIIELAETECNMRKIVDNNTLETQTSMVSITENKSVEYRIEVTRSHQVHDVIDNEERAQTVERVKEDIFINGNIQPMLTEYFSYEPSPSHKPKYENVTCNQFLHALEDKSSKLVTSCTEDNDVSEDQYRSNCSSDCDSSEEVLQIENIDSNNGISEDKTIHFTSSRSDSSNVSDIEEDSLATNFPESCNKDVKELHEKIFKNEEIRNLPDQRFCEHEIWRFGTLTPLTEETKKESVPNMTEDSLEKKSESQNHNQEETLFTSAAGVKIKVLKEDDTSKSAFKLPPIKNNSCPCSPHLNSIFGKPKLNKAGTLPSLYEKPKLPDRWEITNKNLASGESALNTRRDENIYEPRKPFGTLQLPPIQGEALVSNKDSLHIDQPLPPPSTIPDSTATPSDYHNGISIKDKIKDLKMSSKRSWSKYSSYSRADSRSISPVSAKWTEDGGGKEVIERSCDVICNELLKRLRSTSWFDVIESLEDLPKELERYWEIITETRIADLVRQVNMLVESPRPQVAKTACTTVAAILKNTNFTRKPDFHETVTTLLIKTGSYSRVLRRAANLALDHIVCGVDITQVVTAICVHGVGHKNALVRCAAARLIVVCCALANGGRALLRTRPSSAATARRHVLRSLAALLDDKSADTRKYAERLYSMLRPLSNFEAYYLTDVDVELASKQMKKYDQLLLPVAAKENR